MKGNKPWERSLREGRSYEEKGNDNRDETHDETVLDNFESGPGQYYEKKSTSDSFHGISNSWAQVNTCTTRKCRCEDNESPHIVEKHQDACFDSDKNAHTIKVSRGATKQRGKEYHERPIAYMYATRAVRTITHHATTLNTPSTERERADTAGHQADTPITMGQVSTSGIRHNITNISDDTTRLPDSLNTTTSTIPADTLESIHDEDEDTDVSMQNVSAIQRFKKVGAELHNRFASILHTELRSVAARQRLSTPPTDHSNARVKTRQNTTSRRTDPSWGSPIISVPITATNINVGDVDHEQNDDPGDDSDSEDASSSSSEASSSDDDSSANNNDSSSDSSESSDESLPSERKRNTSSAKSPRKQPPTPTVPTTAKKTKIKVLVPKTKSKKGRNAHKIFYELSKNADRFNLPQLSCHADPKRRRNSFLFFIDKLRSVLNITKETSKMLQDTVNWVAPHTTSANNALFWLLEANVDRSLGIALSELHQELSEYDGLAALINLQGICAARDADERHDAITRFQSSTIEEGESIQHFNSRFNRLASHVLAAGKSLSSSAKLRQYFRALQQHPSSHMVIELQVWKQTFERRDPISLSQLQLAIQRKEERLFPQVPTTAHRRTEPKASTPPSEKKPFVRYKSRDDAKSSGRRKDFKSQRRQRDASANAAQTNDTGKKTFLKDGTELKCYSCGGNHALKHCETTSADDKAKIYDERRKKYAKKSSASASNVRRVAFINMVHAQKPEHTQRRKKHKRKKGAISEIVTHNGLPVIKFGPQVILDSGASDHMTGDANALTDLQPYFIPVMMPDGFVVNCTQKGTMRLAIQDHREGTYTVMPLLDTLLVEGLRSHLVSIPALNKSGISAQFDIDHARITINNRDIVIDDPYHRKAREFDIPFAAPVNRQEVAPDIVPAVSPDASRPPSAQVSLELMHRRMGHRSFKNIVAAETSKAWKGVTIRQAPDEYCVECKIGGIVKAKRGHTPPSEAAKPGDVLFLDVIPNPAKGGPTSKTSFKNYLIVVDAFSRYFVFIGLTSTKTEGIIEALETFCVDHRPYAEYELKDIKELHADAGAYFTSEDLTVWGRKFNIKVIVAAPEHQEMNGLAERLWQTARVMAFRMLTNARLNILFFHHALMYAWQICVVLPAKSTSRLDEDGTLMPTTPHYLYFNGDIPNVSRYRVFGCPAICKVYKRKDKDGDVLDYRNLVQRGVRGIFVGFPVNQAGWSIFIPASRHILASADVSFDEDFSSTAAFPDTLYHDSLPVRPTPTFVDPEDPIAFTGPPLFIEESIDLDAPWAPYTAIPPEMEPDVIYEDEVPVVDIYLPTPDRAQDHGQPKEKSMTDSWDNWIDIEATALLRHYITMEHPHGDTSKDISDPFDVEESPIRKDPDSEYGKQRDKDDVPLPTDHTFDRDSDEENHPPPRQTRRTRYTGSYANHVASVISGRDKHNADDSTTSMTNTLEESLGESGADPTPFMPEPRDAWQILKSPPHIKQAWAKPFCKEVKGLIVTRQVFKMEDPLPGENVTPIMMICKCKIDMFGLIDKLKCRAVFRGDLHHPLDDMDSWNPHASWIGLKVFLATCARRRMYPCQIDFVMAYVQAKMKARVFAMMPDHWKQLLPIELHKWCGRPLLLLKALYGYTYSGKLLYEEQAEFLEKYGMRQTVMVALWKKTLPNEKMLLVLQYSDDFLAACDDPACLEEFKAAISTRFDVEVKPNADWYLQARIRQDLDGNIVLDQQRYSKSIVQRYIPNSSPEPSVRDLEKYESPLPNNFKWTKDENSTSKDEVKSLEDEYGFRYIEAVGSLNYLANTATEELFAIRKACKHMDKPGRNHFKTLLHLLHHLRCYPTQGIIFHRDWKDSSVYKMLLEREVKVSDGTLLWFCDASHGDCDDARSTCCYLGFYQGGVIDASSFVPQPIPHSTAESETMAISLGAMACAYARMGIADILFDDPNRPWTIPMMSDSTAAIAMNSSNKPTKRNRHIDRRYFYGREECLSARLSFHHIGADYSLGDLGTKNLRPEESRYKLSIVEYPVSDHYTGYRAIKELPSTPRSKKGDDEMSDRIHADDVITREPT
jgi:hypothetical protein